jgi:hypothetical protein
MIEFGPIGLWGKRRVEHQVWIRVGSAIFDLRFPRVRDPGEVETAVAVLRGRWGGVHLFLLDAFSCDLLGADQLRSDQVLRNRLECGRLLILKVIQPARIHVRPSWLR